MNRRSFLLSSAAAAGVDLQGAQATHSNQTAAKTMKFGVPVVAGPMDAVLLKDYDPHSSLVVPATKVEKASFPAIDVHTHSHMCQIRTREDAASWVRTMDEVGIE